MVFFVSSRRRQTRCALVTGVRRVLFRSDGPEGAFEITSTGAIDGDRVAMKMDLGSGLAGLAEAEGEALPPGFDQPMEIVIDGATAFLRMRSAEPRVGKECVRTCRYRSSP